MKFLPWNKDNWFSENGRFIKYDKVEHFLLALIGVFLGSFIVHPWFMMLIGLIAGVLWEIKDGIFPYDKETGKIEGFSWKDLIADALGIMGGHILFMNVQFVVWLFELRS